MVRGGGRGHVIVYRTGSYIAGMGGVVFICSGKFDLFVNHEY